MGKIDTYLDFVKEQVVVQRKLAKKYEDSSFRKGQHLKAAKGFADVADFLAEIRSRGTADTSYLNRGDSPQKRISITYEDIENAPDELIKELNLTDTDKQDLLIEYLIAQAGGILSLDKIMVDLYRRTNEVPKRNTIITRLYRMAGKGVIFQVPGKKGVYSTYELTEQDVKKMFGQTDGEVEEAQPTQSAAPSASSSHPSPLKSGLLSTASSPIVRRV